MDRSKICRIAGLIVLWFTAAHAWSDEPAEGSCARDLWDCDGMPLWHARCSCLFVQCGNRSAAGEGNLQAD